MPVSGQSVCREKMKKMWRKSHAEIKKDLEIVFADTIEDILKVAFVKE